VDWTDDFQEFLLIRSGSDLVYSDQDWTWLKNFTVRSSLILMVFKFCEW